MTVILNNSLNIGSFIPFYGDIKMNTVGTSFPFLSSWMTQPDSLVPIFLPFLLKHYPHSTHRLEEVGCRFNGSQWGNKSGVHNESVNVEF